MLYAIMEGMPYLISNGKGYPVSIKKDELVIDEQGVFDTEEIGRYSQAEVIAKLGECSSIEPKKTTRKKAQ